jgi:1-deoxy-D-xylulose-5-phosphate reductoisomerase
MCFPIQYAVTWPDRVPNTLKPLRLAELGHLDFEEPRYEAFPALNLARRAGQNGGVLPAILNAANEEAVKAFLQGRIPFPRIWSLVENAMEQVESFARPSLSDILEADAKARANVQGALQHH